MNRVRGVMMIIACVCIVIGILILLVGIGMGGFEWQRGFSWGTEKTEPITFEINTPFSKIQMDEVDCDVFLLPSEDEECRVVCMDSERRYHTVLVEGDTLNIRQIDRRKWYEFIQFGFGIGWEKKTVKVYLPASEYDSLRVKTISGEITVPETFSFSNVEVESVSGDISFHATAENGLHGHSTSGNLDISHVTGGAVILKTTSGDISLASVQADSVQIQSTSGELRLNAVEVTGTVELKTTSGEIAVENAQGNDAMISSTSGNVELRNVIFAGHTVLKTTSGNIWLSDCDAKTFSVKSTSGDVRMTLLSVKHFITSSTSGMIRVSDSSSLAEDCEIRTTSGNITVTVMVKP